MILTFFITSLCYSLLPGRMSAARQFSELVNINKHKHGISLLAFPTSFVQLSNGIGLPAFYFCHFFVTYNANQRATICENRFYCKGLNVFVFCPPFTLVPLTPTLSLQGRGGFIQGRGRSLRSTSPYPSLQRRGKGGHAGLLPSLMPAEAASPAPLMVSSASFMDDCRSCSTIFTSC